MRDRIEIRGAREHNLRAVDLDLPHGRLIVLTGVSGSGKSSLAFDTIYAEARRRFLLTARRGSRRLRPAAAAAAGAAHRRAAAGTGHRPGPPSSVVALDGGDDHRPGGLPAAAVGPGRPGPLPGMRRAGGRARLRGGPGAGLGPARGQPAGGDGPHGAAGHGGPRPGADRRGRAQRLPAAPLRPGDPGAGGCGALPDRRPPSRGGRRPGRGQDGHPAAVAGLPAGGGPARPGARRPRRSGHRRRGALQRASGLRRLWGRLPGHLRRPVQLQQPGRRLPGLPRHRTLRGQLLRAAAVGGRASGGVPGGAVGALRPSPSPAGGGRILPARPGRPVGASLGMAGGGGPRPVGGRRAPAPRQALPRTAALARCESRGGGRPRGARLAGGGAGERGRGVALRRVRGPPSVGRRAGRPHRRGEHRRSAGPHPLRSRRLAPRGRHRPGAAGPGRPHPRCRPPGSGGDARSRTGIPHPGPAGADAVGRGAAAPATCGRPRLGSVPGPLRPRRTQRRPAREGHPAAWGPPWSGSGTGATPCSWSSTISTWSGPPTCSWSSDPAPATRADACSFGGRPGKPGPPAPPPARPWPGTDRRGAIAPRAPAAG